MASSSLNIEINNEALRLIENEIANRSIQTLKDIGDDGALLLKKIALDFIKEVQNNLDKIEIIEQTELQLKKKRNQLNLHTAPKDPKKVQQYNRFKDQLRSKVLIDTSLDEFFKSCLVFNDNILKVITGKEQKMVIVIPEAGQQPIVMEYTLEELFQQDSGVSILQDITSGKVPRVAGRLKYDIDQMKQKFNQALHKDRIIDDDELKALNTTYNSALFDNYNRFKPYVFWKPLFAQHWFKMKISGGAGDISQGYAYFYYKDINKTFNFAKNHLYNNLDTFFRVGVSQVSNLSGLYAGDISTEEYDLAVKSLKASLPGYVQMFNLATDILKGKIKNANQLKELALKKQYKDPINKQGEKGLRNVVTKALQSEVQKNFNLTK